MGHVRDVHGQPPAALVQAVEADGVVVVARRLGIDGDGIPGAEIRAAGDVLGPDLGRDARRLRFHLGRKVVGQAVLGHDDLEVDARVLETAEHGEHAAGGVAGRRSGGRVISARTIRPGLASPDSSAGNEELVQHAAVEGDHAAAELAVAFEPPDDALRRPLEDADDPALRALGGRALDARHHAVAVHRLLHVDGGRRRCRPPAAPCFSGTTKPKPPGLQVSRPTTRFMREGRPTRAPWTFTTSPSSIIAPQDALQLAARLGVEAEPAHHLPYPDGLARLRQQRQHPIAQRTFGSE